MVMLNYREFFITNFLFYYIKKQIVLIKFLKFSDFFYICLYTYKLGYYENELEKFGFTGSFTTASEIGKIFSLCLARQLKQISFYFKFFYLIEIGAGSGLLAKALILSLNKFGVTFSGYFIFEKSNSLRIIQKENLKNFLVVFNVCWFNKFSKFLTGVILVNEVFDALSPDLYIIKNFVFYEKCVSFSKRYGFYFYFLKATFFSKLFFFDFFFFFKQKNIYYIEYHINYFNLLHFLYSTLTVGYIFIFDYGCISFTSLLSKITLRSFFKNQMSDVIFKNIGICDITTNVNFTYLLFFSEFLGFICCSYVCFSYFLFNCGLIYLLPRLFLVYSLNFKVVKEINMLVSSAEMGSVYKAMILSKKMSISLLSFTI